MDYLKNFLPFIMIILFKIFVTCFLSVLGQDPLSYIKKYYEEHPELKEDKIPVINQFSSSYDFIVIGAGSAGSVMANRLSEIKQWRILLLEAGIEGDYLSDIPLLNRLQRSGKLDWNYTIEPQKNCAQAYNGQYGYPRGKALGGSSTINGMIHMRGNKKDFADWKKLGNPGWGYCDVLKYFKKSENMKIEFLKKSPYHSVNGPQIVDYANYTTGLASTFFEASRELGYKFVDYNGANETGYSPPQFNIKNGRRFEAVKAYLKPASSRENLFIATSALVTKILIDKNEKKAYGVELIFNDQKHSVKARNEVILSGGTINSPQLLMLSGIGPADHLGSLQIPVVKDLKVGFNLRDFVGLLLSNMELDFNNTITKDVLFDQQVIQDYFQNGSGPLSLPVGVEGLAFMNTKYAEQDRPDVELAMSTLNIQTSTQNRAHNFQRYYNTAILGFTSKSVGRVKLKSANPADQPSIDPNCLDSPKDVQLVKEGIKLVCINNF